MADRDENGRFISSRAQLGLPENNDSRSAADRIRDRYGDFRPLGTLSAPLSFGDKALAAAKVPAKMVMDVAGSLGTLPIRLREAMDRYSQTGEYDPAPVLEAATLPMGTGAIAGVPVRAGEAVLGAGAIRPLSELPQAIAKGDTRVSTRFPTGVKSAENPLTQHLSIGTEEMRMDPEQFAHNTAILARYPGFAHLQGMSPEEAAKAYINQAAGNIRFLYENSPADLQRRAPLWYEGANRISDALAQRWGVPRQSASAALASLSPQKDWFMNASLGERVGDIVTGNPRATADMAAWAAANPKLAADPKAMEAIRAIEGKRLDQVDPDQAALFVRAYDEAHNPRNYRSVLPEGDYGDFVRTASGDPAKVAWGTFADINKAVRAIQSGGDMDTLSPLLGAKHKVRSFYNNIEVPNDPRFGDITGDTHQVAAAQMRPLSGSSEAVIQHLASGGPAGSVNAKSSAVTGVQGTYGLVADATRQFAKEYGMLPRAAQSATWEPIRELFPADWKTAKNATAVDDIWKAVDRGELSVDQARRAIFDVAGGIGTPEWLRGGIDTRAPQLGSTYR
ncbi:DUF7178 family protein [Bradyrhizobium arachidis]|nr:hypothetical protein [Bradyrhizobium arachidis]SFV19421.1 hypothetical protein SAMN05192541_1512 [Bradyrhizobium arachidis]